MMTFTTRNIANVLALCFSILLTFKAVQSKTTIELAPGTGFDKLSKSFNVFMFDADGVLWSGTSAIPGSADFVNLLLYNKKKVYVISNGLRPIDAIHKKLNDWGFTVPEAEIKVITPGTILPEMLLKVNGVNGKTVFLSGSDTVQKELEAKGLKVIGGGPYSKTYHTEVKAACGRHLVVSMDADFDMVMARDALSCLSSLPEMKVLVLKKADVPKIGNNVHLGVESILAFFQATMPEERRLQPGGFEEPKTLAELLTKLKAQDTNALKQKGIHMVSTEKKPLGDFYTTPTLNPTPENIAAMVFSIDFEFSMKKARDMVTYLSKNENIAVMATGGDHQMPPISASKIGASNAIKKPVYPDVGGIVAFIRAALPNHNKMKNLPVLGKPGQAVLEHLVAQDANSIENYKTLFIGDNLLTDIEFGNSFKGNTKKPGTKPTRGSEITQPITTLLVGTGNHKMADVKSETNDLRVPVYFAASLESLLSAKNKQDLAAKKGK
ncbi:haloacid dehalogenase-like hydrolase domain-containing protein [Ditylenchus destructor]|uniref:Haloacid dehalogenase-like hydrolase domain-containing protein n=1 Tax=Ditylenchus destructor TaxID=166010 RepID=A0AAD4MJW8_9BILA|nr:haloacid dehalogenase-like hydrolase domain-containing protein [Ditylenchus destructor]